MVGLAVADAPASGREPRNLRVATSLLVPKLLFIRNCVRPAVDTHSKVRGFGTLIRLAKLAELHNRVELYRHQKPRQD